MFQIDPENTTALLLAAQEIMDTTGQLWVSVGDEEYYIPELLEQLKKIEKENA